MKCVTTALFLVFLAAQAGWAEDPIPPAARMPFSGTEKGYVVVHRPGTGHPPNGYPVCLWFHGTGLEPNIGPIGWEPLNAQWVGIGMSYIDGSQDAVETTAHKTWTLCESVINRVAEEIPIDRTRVFVGGFSRGGWTAFMLADLNKPGLAGAVVIGGGKHPAWPATDLRYKKPFSVLVACGETDYNFPNSQDALRRLIRKGAGATYEEYIGSGHTLMPTRRILDWFRLQGAPPRAAMHREAPAGSETHAGAAPPVGTCPRGGGRLGTPRRRVTRTASAVRRCKVAQRDRLVDRPGADHGGWGLLSRRD